MVLSRKGKLKEKKIKRGKKQTFFWPARETKQRESNRVDFKKYSSGQYMGNEIKAHLTEPD